MKYDEEKYDKLLELYRQNKLDAQDRRRVLRDIQRQEAISEYLCEQEEDRLVFGEAAGHDKNGDIPDDFTPRGQSDDPDLFPNDRKLIRDVNRSIRRAFIKMGVVVCGITIIVMLAVIFLLPGAVSLFYYDPGKMVGTYTNQMSRDMAVYTELNVPGYYRSQVSVSGEGYGNYDIVIPQNYSLNTTMTNINGRIEKGEMILYNPNILRRPPSNIFIWSGIMGDSDDRLTDLAERYGGEGNLIGVPEGYMEEYLTGLQENQMYVAYVTLDRILPYEEFSDFIDEKEVPALWCAPCTQNGIGDMQEGNASHSFITDNLGFNCRPFVSSDIEFDTSKYPELILFDTVQSIDQTAAQGTDPEADADHLSHDSMDYTTYFENLEKNIRKEDYMKTHFVSLLRYMADQTAFLELMGESQWEQNRYAQAADYIQSHGLMIYGFVCVADQEQLLQMMAYEEIYAMKAQPLV